MRRLRISAISYLNTAPLMWDFEHGDAGAEFDISYTVPSGCAAQLSDGSADIGIIPAAAYATIPDLLILPGVAIASRHQVRSILLVSKVPLEKIRTVALDTCSLTSVALTKVLFAKGWGGGRRFTPMEPDVDEMLKSQDAGLVIARRAEWEQTESRRKRGRPVKCGEGRQFSTSANCLGPALHKAYGRHPTVPKPNAA